MAHEFQQQQGAPGQQAAGTSQYGGAAGTQMGQQGGSQTMQPSGSSTGQFGGGQGGGAMGGEMMGGGMGLRLSDVETPQQRTAVEDITRAIQVCGWCSDQCVQEADPSMIECIRLCEDVTELGETVLAMLPRSSRFSDQVLGTFQQAVQDCAQECGQHPHEHCQECAEELGYAMESIQQLYGTYGQQGGFQQSGGQQGGMTGEQTTTW